MSCSALGGDVTQFKMIDSCASHFIALSQRGHITTWKKTENTIEYEELIQMFIVRPFFLAGKLQQN